MSKPLKIIVGLFAVIVALCAGLAIFVGTLDADKYRPQLVEALSKKTGRDVKLDGPISFSLGLGNIHVAIQDASISNAPWGSRPVMAGMGKFELGLGLLPLLSHRLSIDKLSIENADILLETNSSGQHNWDFPAGAAKPAETQPTAPSSAPSGASISVNDVHIVNSQLAMRGADGKTSSFNVASLDLSMHGGGAKLTFNGDANGTPIALNVKTSITDLLSRGAFTFDADMTCDPIHLTAQGKADIDGGKADISSYQVTAGKTTIKGAALATWNGPHPLLQGSLNSDNINPADFKLSSEPAGEEPGAKQTEATSAASTSASKRIFSDAALPLEALRAANANLDVAVGALEIGKGALKNISAKLALENGNLTLSPVKANIGATPVDVQLNLNATQSPAQFSIKIAGNGIDLSELQKLGAMAPFITGNASANIQLTGQGNSPHEIASNLVGVIVVSAEKGQILTGVASQVSSLLGALFSGGSGNDAMNCLAARFIARNGVLNDNGILIDSAASVVSGKGNVSLGSETVALTLNAKTKLVDIGGLVPGLQISGGLSSPHYSVNAAGVIQNVVGSLVNGNMNVIASSVPDIQVAPAGENACIYTLDHPKAASASPDVLSTNPLSNAKDKVKNLGGSVLKGLFGQ